ncbi:MAG: rhomboid family intramembrane serine protease [Proteiniphilum sp.]|jgi:membrane associated rhomboid family serine protease|nr:rhomboid family intramembrane serine protease [Proteiniphilum sp.]MDD3779520.1 rhomboid family intramembrane serine protease [Proteiniphilum sp.]
MITTIIIIITSLISIKAFKDDALLSKIIFHPPAVKQGGWYRLFTYGVAHADYTHLIFNMFTLYFFGMDIERVLKSAFGLTNGAISYIFLYISALLVSIIPTYFKHKNDSSYYGLGASGAVSAIIFSYVLINPMNFMGIMFIPIMLPAFLFGLVFILISLALEKKQFGGINHSAHITGGIYGIIYMVAVFFVFADTNLISSFISQIKINSISDLFHFGF